VTYRPWTPAVDTGIDLIGGAGRARRRLRTPVAVAPTAFHGLAHPDGELATAADFLVTLGPLADLGAAGQPGDVTFGDIGWLADISGRLPVVVKGVLRPDDASACMAHIAGRSIFAACAPPAYRGVVRAIPPVRRDRAHLVTEAQRPMSEDIAYRQRRYLIMMGIRGVCFAVAVVLFVNVPGFFWAIPAVGAIIIPYFAVVFANGGREPTSTRGFRPYEPRLPVRRTPGEQGSGQGPGGSARPEEDPRPFTASNQSPKGGPETAGR
jgi:Protein of unknown function (DUF3099)